MLMYSVAPKLEIWVFLIFKLGDSVLNCAVSSSDVSLSISVSMVIVLLFSLIFWISFIFDFICFFLRVGFFALLKSIWSILITFDSGIFPIMGEFYNEGCGVTCFKPIA